MPSGMYSGTPRRGDVWPCGHPRTPENTQRIGEAGMRCRECRRKIAREHAQRKAAQARAA